MIFFSYFSLELSVFISLGRRLSLLSYFQQNWIFWITLVFIISVMYLPANLSIFLCKLSICDIISSNLKAWAPGKAVLGRDFLFFIIFLMYLYSRRIQKFQLAELSHGGTEWVWDFHAWIPNLFAAAKRKELMPNKNTFPLLTVKHTKFY